MSKEPDLVFGGFVGSSIHEVEVKIVCVYFMFWQNSALSRCYKLQGVDGSVVLLTARSGWLRRGLLADIIRDDFNFFVFTFTFNWEYFVERISGGGCQRNAGKVKLFECW